MSNYPRAGHKPQHGTIPEAEQSQPRYDAQVISAQPQPVYQQPPAPYVYQQQPPQQASAQPRSPPPAYSVDPIPQHGEAQPAAQPQMYMHQHGPGPAQFQPGVYRGSSVNAAECQFCGEPYALPAGATSFRCKKCNKFNNLSYNECPCCTIA